MDKNHFGDSKAAIVLTILLSKPEYCKYQRRVSSLTNRYNTFVNELDICDLKDETKKLVLRIYHKNFKETFDKYHGTIPPELKRYTLNVVTKNYRAAIKRDKNRNDFRRKMIKKT